MSVEDNQAGHQYEAICGFWYHIGCVNVTKQEYGFIKKIGDKNVWFCYTCKVEVTNLIENRRALKCSNLSRTVGNIENWENRFKASVTDVIVSNRCSAGQRKTAVVEAPEESLAESESNQSGTSSVEAPSGDVGLNKTNPVIKTADENGGKSSSAISSENWADVVKGKRSNRRNKGSSEI
ncbi:hypothetical protein J6590_104035 [Homalodisca vitripennis]|nr:hypothetical protein J6590_104035 [Homalodisca vitripennis]